VSNNWTSSHSSKKICLNSFRDSRQSEFGIHIELQVPRGSRLKSNSHNASSLAPHLHLLCYQPPTHQTSNTETCVSLFSSSSRPLLRFSFEDVTRGMETLPNLIVDCLLMRYSGQSSSSIDARDLDASAVATATQAVAESRYPYTKKIKTTSTKSHSTTPLATRAVSTPGNEPLATSSCIPSSICVDKISPCGHRYGG
jgi:hypothetical protein